MKTLKYSLIKSKTQYKEYCSLLGQLLSGKHKNKQNNNEIELLSLLIEKWDTDHTSFESMDPVQLLYSLMAEKDMKAKDLADELNVSKSLVSEILNYKKGFSKEIIRSLAKFFKVSQEAFNRVYNLKSPSNSQLRNVSVMKKGKLLAKQL